MPQTVPGEISDPGCLEGFLESPAWISGAATDKFSAAVLLVQLGQCSKRRCVQRHVAGLPALIERDCEDAALEVHVSPASVVLLGKAHSSVER